MTKKTESDKPGTCEVCGSTACTGLFPNEDFISGESFQIVRCLNCGLARTVFSRPLSELSKYYGASYYGDSGRRFPAPLEGAISHFRDARAMAVAGLFGRPGSVLDIGCGRGLMLSTLKKSGWDCHGTELSKDLCDAARRRDGIDVKNAALQDCGFEGDSFDLVTMWHTLEHMPDPGAVLGEAFRILKPNGALVVEVPDFGGLQAKIGGGKWFHLDAPRHLYHISRGDLRRMLESRGFRVEAEENFSIEYGVYGMLQTLLNLATAGTNVLYYRVLRKIPHGGEPRPLSLLFDIAASIGLFLPAAAAALPLECAGALAKRGGIVRLTARKPAGNQQNGRAG